jgi:hypothetical protein
MHKTFKREIALVLLVWLAYVVETKDVNVIEALVWPIFGFAAAAFGLDALSKQLQQPSRRADRRRPEHSGEWTGGQD